MNELSILKDGEYRHAPPQTAGNKALYLKIFGAALLFLFLLPYVITSLFGNISAPGLESSAGKLLGEWEKQSANSNIYIENSTAIGRENIPLEIYLLDKLARTVNTDYHLEALKAQAVLLRTALIEELWRDSGALSGRIRIAEPEYGQGVINHEDVILAVMSTKGIILTHQNTPAKVAYFAVSNGRTRDGKEALGQDALPYLVPTDCQRDFLAENFISQKTVSKSEFISTLEKIAAAEIEDDLPIGALLIKRDSGNYVIDITIAADDSPPVITLSGEEFRHIWGLNSACFTIEENKNKIIFSVKGAGHGLGLSQFSANEMAKNDSDYISILEYFFPGTKLEKFE